MNRTPPRVIELTEASSSQFPPLALSKAEAELLWRNYGPQVAVDFPSPKTEGQWQLTAQNWVGHIPLTPDFHLRLQPKVELGNLFQMLEYAYRLKSFRFLDGLITCQSLADFYERLAHVLAGRVLERGRQGFYRAYLPQTARLPYVRGRLEMRQASQTPGQINLACHYAVQTADIEDNQILAWTLWSIARSGLCSERTLPTVRRAYRALQGLVTLPSRPPRLDQERLYHRLNEDYRPMHALCRFFLEQSGPSYQAGDRPMLPFLVEMTRLYELFVAEWLKVHLPAHLMLEAQAKVDISASENLHFEIDLVLSEGGPGGAARSVLDTKYKTPTAPATDDIAQVVAYAQAKQCHEAILIYPAPLVRPLDSWVGDIRVRSLTFSLNGDLEQAGQRFLQELLAKV